jgi:hypothetical protein
MLLQHGTFSALHDWCIMNQDTNEALRELHGTGKSDSANNKKPSGNSGNSGSTASTNNSSGSRVVRVIPFKFKGLGRLSDNPAELKRVTEEGRCIGCRKKGHTNSQDSKCVFYSPRGAFKFSDVYKETTIADYEAGKNKPRGGNTHNNAMQLAAVHDHDDHHPLPMAEDHMIEDGHEGHHHHGQGQGNGMHRR